MSSEITIDNSGTYGTLGTPAAANLPGARLGSASWTDTNGNLWLFGGYGFDNAQNAGYLNDLWEFNLTTNTWVWMGGSNQLQATCFGGAVADCGHSGVYGGIGQPGTQNSPGGRWYPAYWTDKNGNFWLFGGAGFDAEGNLGELNDLWEFDPSTSTWMWMGGNDVVGANGGQAGIYGTLGSPSAGNIPGGRDSATIWLDSIGNFWLYGGEGFDSQGNFAQLNDLWKYVPANNQWTWVNGNNVAPTACIGSAGGICGQVAIYGDLGVPATANNPGGRLNATAWTDKGGNSWLYGGLADSTGAFNSTSEGVYTQYDLWEYNPSSNEWAWMGGNSTAVCGAGNDNYWCNEVGVLGTVGTPSAADLPPGREYGMSWTDNSGNFWLWGGLWSSDPEQNGTYYANDLWAFMPSQGEWVPMNGANSGTPPGWGTQGAPAPGNIPSPRFASATWTDKSGNFWLFGGQGYGANTEYPNTYDSFPDLLNDLWVYEPVPISPVPSFAVNGPPSPVFAVAGSAATALIDVIAADQFNSPVSLAVVAATLPNGITASVSPASITGGGTATVTFNVVSGISGDTTIGLTATSGETTQSAIVRLITTSSPPSYTLQANPSSLNLMMGQNGTTTLLVTPMNGFSGEVNFSCTVAGSPTGLSCSAPPISVSPALASGSTLALETSSTTPGGSYQLTIVGSDAATGLITSKVTLTVNISAEFGVPSGFLPSAISIAPGATTGNSTTISVVGNNGFSGSVNLSCSIVPGNVSNPPACTLSPATLNLSGTTAQNATLTINTTAATNAENRIHPLGWRNAGGGVLAFVVLMTLPRRKRSWRALLSLLVLASSLGASGCGGGTPAGSGAGGGGNSGGGTAGTTPGTYSVVVNGASSGVSVRIATVQLIVN